MKGKLGFYESWAEARDNAVMVSRWGNGLDVAIRKTIVYPGGPKGFQVKLASRSDSDYALAEIVPANSQI
jgi:hypothetical protein